MLSRLQTAKETILNEFSERLTQHEHMLHLAVNEAEALAWESGVPQLVFASLAMEKAEAVAKWHARQQSMRQANPRQAFAA